MRVSARNAMLGAVLALSTLSSVTTANDAVWFSQGPTIPYTQVRFDKAGKAHADVLTVGAGYSFNFNFYPTQDGSIRKLTLSTPIFVSHEEGTDFRLSAGAAVGTLNNLFSVGAVIDLVKVAEMDSGAFLCEVGKENVRIVLGLNFNLGSGAPEQGIRSAGILGSAAKVGKPPPGYLSW